MLFELFKYIECIMLTLSLGLGLGITEPPAESFSAAEDVACTREFKKMDRAIKLQLMNYSKVSLSFPELNYETPCKYCPLDFAQYYVDMPNMAAMFLNTLIDEPGQLSFEIGDHNNQGFEIIKKLEPGMSCVISFNGKTQEYICTKVDKSAVNAIDCLQFSDGTLLDPSYPLGIYTCNVDGKTVTLCCFEPIDN